MAIAEQVDRDFSEWNNTAMLLNPDGSPKWRFVLEPFRRALEETLGRETDEEPLSVAGIERAAGLSDSRLTRLLGYRKQQGGRKNSKAGVSKRYASYASSLSYNNAVKIARVLDMDFKELGL